MGFHAPLHVVPRPRAVAISPPPINATLSSSTPVRVFLRPVLQTQFPAPRQIQDSEQSKMASLMDKAKGFVADKVTHMPKPEASLDSVTYKSMTREAITVHSNVNVTNPYSHRIPICEVTYTLKFGGKAVASGTMPDPGWIEESGETTKLELPAKVPYDFLISLMKDLGRDWDIDYELEVGLTIDIPIIGNFTIPLSTSGEMKLPTLSDIF